MYAQSYPLTRVTLISRIDYSVFERNRAKKLNSTLLYIVMVVGLSLTTAPTTRAIW